MLLCGVSALACTAALGIEDARRSSGDAAPDAASPDAPKVFVEPLPVTSATAECAGVATGRLCPPRRLLSQLPPVLEMVASETHLAMAIQGGNLVCALPDCREPTFLPAEGPSTSYAMALTRKHFAVSAFPSAMTTGSQTTRFAVIGHWDAMRRIPGVAQGATDRSFFIAPPLSTSTATPTTAAVEVLAEGEELGAFPLDAGSPVARVGDVVYTKSFRLPELSACRAAGIPPAVTCERTTFDAQRTTFVRDIAVFTDAATGALAICRLPDCQRVVTTLPMSHVSRIALTGTRAYAFVGAKGQLYATALSPLDGDEPRIIMEGLSNDTAMAGAGRSLYIAREGVLQRFDEAAP